MSMLFHRFLILIPILAVAFTCSCRKKAGIEDTPPSARGADKAGSTDPNSGERTEGIDGLEGDFPRGDGSEGEYGSDGFDRLGSDTEDYGYDRTRRGSNSSSYWDDQSGSYGRDRMSDYRGDSYGFENDYGSDNYGYDEFDRGRNSYDPYGDSSYDRLGYNQEDYRYSQNQYGNQYDYNNRNSQYGNNRYSPNYNDNSRFGYDNYGNNSGRYDYNDRFVNFSSNPIVNPNESDPYRQDIQFAIPVRTTAALTSMSEDDWTWKLQLNYEDSSKNKSDSGELEFRDDKAIVSMRSVPVGTAKLRLELHKSETLIYVGNGKASIEGGKTTDATIVMKKVSDQGDLNIKPEFPEGDGPSTQELRDFNDIPELKQWDGLKHVGRNGISITPKSL